MIDPDADEIRARQRARARITGLALGALVVLIFLIAIVRMSQGGE